MKHQEHRYDVDAPDEQCDDVFGEGGIEILVLGSSAITEPRGADDVVDVFEDEEQGNHRKDFES